MTKVARYREGDFFVLPVPNGVFGAGLVARGKRGFTPFCYVFGAWDAAPSLEDLEVLRPSDAVFSGRFIDNPLRDGTWPILGRRSAWSRELWPMPEFGMSLGEDGWARRMSDDDPFDMVVERSVSPREADRLPRDAFHAHVEAWQAIDPSWDWRSDVAFKAAAGWDSPPGQDADIFVFFLTPDRDRAHSVVDELAADGWVCDVIDPKETNDVDRDEATVMVRASRSAASFGATRDSLDAMWDSLDERMSRLARSHGVSYDGHGASG